MKPAYMLKAREAIARIGITDLPTVRFIYRHERAHARVASAWSTASDLILA